MRLAEIRDEKSFALHLDSFLEDVSCPQSLMYEMKRTYSNGIHIDAYLCEQIDVSDEIHL